MTQVYVIIPAAGRGRRFGSATPKQYQRLGQNPVLWHTLRRFEEHALIDRIVVAIHPDEEDVLLDIARGCTKVAAPVHGGTERVDSVHNALLSLPPGSDRDVVLVHDAVRPWVSSALIEAIVAAARQHGAVIPALPVTETVKVVDDEVVAHTPDRSTLYNAQTPQGFRRSVLEQAFAGRAAGAVVTDEASLVEASGVTVHVVPGETENVKITRPEDLPSSAGADLRVGTGYDVHAFAEGRKLILGGIEVDHERGLAGHSDADVLTHSVIDALLGAAGMGDIGRLFPDTDPAFAGIDSMVLLARVRDRLADASIDIVNVDTVVMAQAPKLAPYVDGMCARLAEELGIDSGRVSVKATTTERLGFVGRAEGIAAQATALLRVPAAP